MTQEEKFTARLRQILSESGLHEITIHVGLDKSISFWFVTSRKVEGENSSTISGESSVSRGNKDIVHQRAKTNEQKIYNVDA